MQCRCTQRLKQFNEAEGGAVAILFGLASIAILLFSGLAVDYSRIVDFKGGISRAVDAASLAAGRALLEGKLTDSEIEDLARQFVMANTNTPSRQSRLGEPKIRIDRESGEVDILVDAELNMTIGRLAGIDHMAVPVRSTAVFAQKDIEVGMALDITGSMRQQIDGVQKMDALKTAFNKFADTLIPDHQSLSQKVRIGLAPYAAAINLGPAAALASGNRSRDGCVVENRLSVERDSLSEFEVADRKSRNRDPSGSRFPYACPSSRLKPLSDDKRALIDEVERYTPNGSTGGHFGVQWAWNILSDSWSTAWLGDSRPDSYDLVENDKLIKAVVLMTDGEFNTAYNGPNSSTQAENLCTAMKDKGVLVFAVGFGLGGNTKAINTLKNCATEGDGYFVDARNAKELEEAFEKFADRLTALRLSS